MDDDYKHHVQYKKQVMKVKRKRMPIHEGRSNVLPPMEGGALSAHDKSMNNTGFEAH
jgi:hypothetical protein